MSYVKWNSSKFHILSSLRRGYRIVNGQASSSRDGGGPDESPLTNCGADVPVDNEVFESLPEGIDRYNDVCHKCDSGVGVHKVNRDAEQAEADAKREKQRTQMRKAAAISAEQARINVGKKPE